MLSRFLAAVAAVVVAFPAAAQNPVPADLGASVQKQLPGLEETYKHLHRKLRSLLPANCASWDIR